MRGGGGCQRESSLDPEPLSAYPAGMNVPSGDDDLLEHARGQAQRRGGSLHEIVRDQLRPLAGERSGADAARELLDLMQEHGGHSGGRPWRRQDAYGGAPRCHPSVS